MTSGLLSTHIAFLEALRGAGVPVSLAEDLDAIAAFSVLDWGDREAIRQGYAATLVKRQAQRPTFDTLFDLYFPRLVGEGVATADRGRRTADGGRRHATAPRRSRTCAPRLAEALADGDEEALRRLAAEAVGRFGAMRGRGPGLSSWSAYTTLQRVSPADAGRPGRRGAAGRRPRRRRGAPYGGPARRRPSPGWSRPTPGAGSPPRRDPTTSRGWPCGRASTGSTSPPPARPTSPRCAARSTRWPGGWRPGWPASGTRGAAARSTSGVPSAPRSRPAASRSTTHHKPKRPHRTELVVLCDVSGSVASFAQFTLMLVFALREQFGKVRAFTFVDQVHEVTDVFRPGADLGDVMAGLAARTAQAALWGRTNYGRAFTTFADEYADALGPRTSLLILGDARSNYSDLGVDVLQDLAGRARHAYWLNPEHPRHWDTGDSAAGAVRRGRADGRVPQPRPALRVRPLPALTVALSRVIWRTWLVAVARPPRNPCGPQAGELLADRGVGGGLGRGGAADVVVEARGWRRSRSRGRRTARSPAARLSGLSWPSSRGTTSPRFSRDSTWLPAGKPWTWAVGAPGGHDVGDVERRPVGEHRGRLHAALAVTDEQHRVVGPDPGLGHRLARCPRRTSCRASATSRRSVARSRTSPSWLNGVVVRSSVPGQVDDVAHPAVGGGEGLHLDRALVSRPVVG